jgi:hypothetical protein
MSSVSAIVRKFQFIFIAILDNLLKLVLSRKNLSVKLLPEQNIVSDNENGWWITNTPAYFALQIENGLYHHGWFYIEGVLHRYSLTRAKLYYNDGTGFSTDNYFFIPVTRRGYIREVIFLPLGVIGLRWAPVDSSRILYPTELLYCAHYLLRGLTEGFISCFIRL